MNQKNEELNKKSEKKPSSTTRDRYEHELNLLYQRVRNAAVDECKKDYPELDPETDMFQKLVDSDIEVKNAKALLDTIPAVMHMFSEAGLLQNFAQVAYLKDIVDRCIDWKPLTPIEAVTPTSLYDPAEWMDQTEISGGDPTFQSARCPSLFFYPDTEANPTIVDGKVVGDYVDVDHRPTYIFMPNGVSYTSNVFRRGHLRPFLKFLEKKHPELICEMDVKMPYMPTRCETYEVNWTHQVLTDMLLQCLAVLDGWTDAPPRLMDDHIYWVYKIYPQIVELTHTKRYLFRIHMLCSTSSVVLSEGGALPPNDKVKHIYLHYICEYDGLCNTPDKADAMKKHIVRPFMDYIVQTFKSYGDGYLINMGPNRWILPYDTIDPEYHDDNGKYAFAHLGEHFARMIFLPSINDEDIMPRVVSVDDSDENIAAIWDCAIAQLMETRGIAPDNPILFGMDVAGDSAYVEFYKMHKKLLEQIQREQACEVKIKTMYVETEKDREATAPPEEAKVEPK